MGRPPPRGLARVRMSGVDPRVLEGEHLARCARGRTAPRRTRASAPRSRQMAARPLQELRRRGPDAALALHRLDHHRRGLSGRPPRPPPRGRSRAGSARRARAARTARGTSRSRWWRGRPWCGRGRRARSRRTRCGPAPCRCAARTSSPLPTPRCPSCRRRPWTGRRARRGARRARSRARCGRGCSRGSASPPARGWPSTILRSP